MFAMWSLKLLCKYLGVCRELYLSLWFPLTHFIVYEKILWNGNSCLSCHWGPIPKDFFLEQKKPLLVPFTPRICAFKNKMSKVKLSDRIKYGELQYYRINRNHWKLCGKFLPPPLLFKMEMSKTLTWKLNDFFSCGYYISTLFHLLLFHFKTSKSIHLIIILTAYSLDICNNYWFHGVGFKDNLVKKEIILW